MIKCRFLECCHLTTFDAWCKTGRGKNRKSCGGGGGGGYVSFNGSDKSTLDGFLWRLCLELWEEVAALRVNPELAVGLNGHLHLAGRICCPISARVVFALESVARESLLALALLVCRVANLLTGRHKTTLGDVLTSCLHSITLLVLCWFAMPSTLLWVRG